MSPHSVSNGLYILRSQAFTRISLALLSLPPNCTARTAPSNSPIPPVPRCQINPEGKGKAVFRVYCDMEERKWKDGGGWTLVFVQEGSSYRAWHSNCPERELLDPRLKGGGCGQYLASTLGKAKYIRSVQH